MKRAAVVAAVTLAMSGIHALGAASAASEPPPVEPGALVDAFVAWAESASGPVSAPACHLPETGEPAFAVCYGVGSGGVVVSVLAVDDVGAPGAATPLPLPTSRDATEASATAPPDTDGAADPASFGPGQHEVGGDIAAGAYVAIVPAAGTCYWERVSGFSGELSDSIANGSAAEGQVVIVEIESGDAGFASEGCGTWTLLG